MRNGRPTHGVAARGRGPRGIAILQRSREQPVKLQGRNIWVEDDADLSPFEIGTPVKWCIAPFALLVHATFALLTICLAGSLLAGDQGPGGDYGLGLLFCVAAYPTVLALLWLNARINGELPVRVPPDASLPETPIDSATAHRASSPAIDESRQVGTVSHA